MILYSVHDTSVASLLIALGIFEDKWPDFAADLAFELYRDKVIMIITLRLPGQILCGFIALLVEYHTGILTVLGPSCTNAPLLA